MSEHSRFAHGLTSVMLAAELVVTSGVPAAPAPGVEAATVQVAPESETPLDIYYSLPNTPCGVTTKEDKRAQCLEIHRSTRIALVNFDFTPQEANAMAEQMKPAFDNSTGGVFNAQPTVIPASEAAKAKARENRGPLNCVKNFEYFGSVAAQQMMSEELGPDRYDMVVALTDARACDNEKEAGEAESIPGRYADLLAGSLSPEDKQSATYKANILAHEVGHLAGFGHESLIGCSTEEAYNPATIGLFDVFSGSEEFDISAYLQGRCFLEQYNPFAKGVMGPANFQPGEKAKVNPIQLNAIMRPEIEKGLAVPLDKQATRAGVTLTTEEARNNKYVSVPLGQVLKPLRLDLDHPEYGASSVSTRELSLVPRITGTGPDASIEGIDVNMLGTENNAVRLGRLTFIEGYSFPEWNFRIADTRLHVSLQGRNMLVRDQS